MGSSTLPFPVAVGDRFGCANGSIWQLEDMDEATGTLHFLIILTLEDVGELGLGYVSVLPDDFKNSYRNEEFQEVPGAGNVREVVAEGSD